MCVWACICGVWGETEAERPSQAKDNSVCVWGVRPRLAFLLDPRGLCS